MTLEFLSTFFLISNLAEIDKNVIRDNRPLNKPKNKYECRHENSPAIKTAIRGPIADPIDPNIPCIAIPLETFDILCDIRVNPVGW